MTVETPTGYLNDLWSYDIIKNWWTWLSGSDNFDSKGVYGLLDEAAAENVPGARWGHSMIIECRYSAIYVLGGFDGSCNLTFFDFRAGINSI